MHINLTIKLLLIFFLTVIFRSLANSQTVDEAWKVYAIGKTAQKEGKLPDAITAYTSCLEICQKIEIRDKSGETEIITGNIRTLLPGLYLESGKKKLEEQLLEEALENTLKAKELAIPVKDTSTVRKAEKLIALIYYQSGIKKIDQNNPEGALSDMEKAIKSDPDYLTAYYLKAFIIKKMEDDTRFMTACLVGLQAADRLKDEITRNKITDLGFQYFQRKGLAAKNNQHVEEAATLLANALKFKKSDLTTLYLLATTYNSLGRYNDAIKTAENALSYETGNEESKAQYYLIIGESYAKLGNSDMACKTFAKAAVGNYADYANHYMKYTLKCQ